MSGGAEGAEADGDRHGAELGQDVLAVLRADVGQHVAELVPGAQQLALDVDAVLASINGVLAQHGVNVEGQLLRTRDELGYVLTDIGSEYGEDVLAELRAMPVTIRLRTLRSP